MVDKNYNISILWRSQLGRRIAMVASGTIGAHIINIAFAPLLTRIYGPEAFGILGAFTAILAVGIPLAALAYPIAIILPREEYIALGLARLSFFLSILIATFAVLLIWLYGDIITAAIGAQSVEQFLYLIPLGMLFASWKQIAEQWLIRKKRFGLIAKISIYHSFSINGIKVCFGWFWPIGMVLIATLIFGYALNALFLYFSARHSFKFESEKNNTTSSLSLKSLAIKYSDFPLYRSPQNIINAASQSFPVLILATFFGPLAAGYYSLATLAMAMPSALLGKAVSDVFYPHITEAAYDGHNLSRQILQIAGILFAIGIFPFGIIMFYGPEIFSFIFGSNWILAGEYARWLALFFLFNFINQPFVAAVPVLGIQRGLLFYEFYSTGGKILGFLAGYYWFASDLWSIGIFAIAGVIAYIGLMIWIYFHVKRWSKSEEAGK